MAELAVVKVVVSVECLGLGVGNGLDPGCLVEEGRGLG